jgi:NAD+ kinase
VREAEKRPVSAVADHTEVRSVASVVVSEAHEIDLLMMFDAGHNLDERSLLEQFRY